ncbi:hypothetical protein HDU97_004522 [Phlyctochytrium planicorne]|nr:hypothetical protein HDU97_004522 [Phlyctochytrium planicorne]
MSADSLEDDFVPDELYNSKKRKGEDEEEEDDDAQIASTKPEKAKKKGKFWQSFKDNVFSQAGVSEDTETELPEDRSLDSLSSFVESGIAVTSSLISTMIVKDNSKRVVVITMSAERAIEIIPRLKKSIKVAKLFARHMKVKDQVEVLKKKDVSVCVGTPNRIAKVMELGALTADNISYVIFDGAADKKERTVFSMKELEPDVLSILKHCNSDQKILIF